MGMRAYGFRSGHEEQDVWELVPFGVGSGRVGLGRVGSGRVGSGRVGSGQGTMTSCQHSS